MLSGMDCRNQCSVSANDCSNQDDNRIAAAKKSAAAVYARLGLHSAFLPQDEKD